MMVRSDPKGPPKANDTDLCGGCRVIPAATLASYLIKTPLDANYEVLLLAINLTYPIEAVSQRKLS